MNSKVLIICGPTASGKTDAAVRVAKIIGGEVISADSMQLYREMNIGTAKPTEEEKQGVKHYMIDTVDITENYSAADYKDECYRLCRDILSRGKTPIIAGGTGQYISAVVENLTYGDIPHDAELREALTRGAAEKGGEYMKSVLAQFDRESAERLHENDIRRIVRAIEIYKLTGITQTEFNRRSKENPPPYDFVITGLKFEDRALLYERIDKRVDLMMSNGLLEEAERIYGLSPSKTAAQAIGYKELFDYFEGKCTLFEAVDKIKQESRRYAKRQLTWFNHVEGINWFYPDKSAAEDIAREIASLMESKETNV